MNLVMGIFWLVAAVATFGYQYQTGETGFRIRVIDISAGWLFLMIALYNFARWYGRRMKVHDKTPQYLREARLRQAQRRERSEPDPNFDFSNDPPERAQGIRPPIDQPPSNN